MEDSESTSLVKADPAPVLPGRRKRYAGVNAIGLPHTPLDPREAKAAALKLFRLGRKLVDQSPPVKNKKVHITSGNRHTYMRGYEVVVNPDRGWHGLVHDISHDIVRLHTAKHEWLERQLAEHVRASGWLEGKLRRPVVSKPAPDPISMRQQRVLAGIERWEAKLRRARTALKKLYRQKAYYAKKLAA